MNDTSSDDNRNRVTKRRTDWAEDRTILATERIFASWIDALGVAIGLNAVFGAFEPIWAAKAVASRSLAAAILIFRSARNHARKTRKHPTRRNTEAQSARSITSLGTIPTTATMLTGATLWSP
ncbi:DUF202 domain-containing protein [Gymnodinialimonas sp. 2305UL16-5]|uniref:DUF202 domain-containing protein n=1 Tax=Gymnodinialimonas mytili TaxID=3126503 RepID=UPI0030A7B6D4